MIEIIVVSDNHGLIDPLIKVKEKHPNASGFIHCGDSELGPEYMDAFVACTGNNDYYYAYPEYVIAELDGIRVYVTHSHQFYADQRRDALMRKGLNNHCSIVCYGHTHVFDVYQASGVTIVNPGSMRYNRDGTEPSYAQIIIDGDTIQVNRLSVSDL